MSDSKIINKTTLRLEKCDITDFEIEAFVYYARSDLQLGAGYGNAISMRGGPSIKKELDELGSRETGEIVISAAGEMKNKYIVHAVGPKFQEEDIESKLHATIINALKAADEKGIKKLAFPPMATGFYGVPLPVSAKIMFHTLNDYFNGQTGLEEVVICLLDNREYQPFEAEFNSFN